MHIQRYLLSLPSSLFIPAINPSKPEIILWTLGPHTSPECPSGQRETLPGTCTALVTGRSARVRHIRVVTVYVTWHVLWRKQWTFTTGIVVVVTIGVKPAHLELIDSTMGPVLLEFHYLLIICSVAKAREFLGEFLLVLQIHVLRQRTVFPIISVFRIISILKLAVTKFISVQIYCIRECNGLC